MRSTVCLLLLLFSPIAAPVAVAQNEFRLRSFEMPLPESGTVTGFAIDFPTNRVVFRPPYEWQLRADAAEKRVTMTHPNRTAAIIMQFVPEPTGKKPELSADKLKEKVLSRFPDGKIMEEFVFHSGAGPAQAFNVDRGTNASNKVTSRCAFLPVEGFWIEFTMTSAAAQTPQLHHSFANLLSSFVLEPLKPKTPPK
jgi:hypothetical protein